MIFLLFLKIQAPHNLLCILYLKKNHTPQFGLATFQVINCDIWVLVTVLDSEVLKP